MLYEVREVNGKFKLFFHKKNGLKFKKSFSSRQDAENIAALYLRYCCLVCLQRGWVYKTCNSGGLHGGGGRWGSENRKLPRGGNPKAESVVFCPECRARYLVQYESEQAKSWGYDSTGWHEHFHTIKRFLLIPSPE